MRKVFHWLLVLIILLGIFSFWQYRLYRKLEKKNVSCKGDWSSQTSCPWGSTCQSLGQGKLAGGICRTWLSPFLRNIDGTNIKSESKKNTQPFPQKRKAKTVKHVTKDIKYIFLYPNNLKILKKEILATHKKTIYIKNEDKTVNKIIFYPPNRNPMLDKLWKDIESKGSEYLRQMEWENKKIAGQPTLWYKQGPYGEEGLTALVKLDGNYVKFVSGSNLQLFKIITESFDSVEAKTKSQDPNAKHSPTKAPKQ